jgi:hypothetical protein
MTISVETQRGERGGVYYLVTIYEENSKPKLRDFTAHSISEVCEAMEHYLGHMHSTCMHERVHCPICRELSKQTDVVNL